MLKPVARPPEAQLGLATHQFGLASSSSSPLQAPQQVRRQPCRLSLRMSAPAEGLRQADRPRRTVVHTIDAHPQLGMTHPAAAPAQARQDPSQLAPIEEEIVGPLDLWLEAQGLELKSQAQRRGQGQRRVALRLFRPGDCGAEPYPTGRRVPHPSLLPVATALAAGQQG